MKTYTKKYREDVKLTLKVDVDNIISGVTVLNKDDYALDGWNDYLDLMVYSGRKIVNKSTGITIISNYTTTNFELLADIMLAQHEAFKIFGKDFETANIEGLTKVIS